MPVHSVTSVVPQAGEAPENQKADAPASNPLQAGSKQPVQEIGGPEGPEPTRYGDWQFNGRVSDF